MKVDSVRRRGTLQAKLSVPSRKLSWVKYVQIYEKENMNTPVQSINGWKLTSIRLVLPSPVTSWSSQSRRHAAPNIQKSPFVFFSLTCFQLGKPPYSSLLISSAFCGSKHMVSLRTSRSCPRLVSSLHTIQLCNRSDLWVQTHARWASELKTSAQPWVKRSLKLDGNKQFGVDEALLKLTDARGCSADSPPTEPPQPGSRRIDRH